ncbi:ATP synthase F0 sector subunit b [hydrothermal vent metagenome]|uniref:ATP synthase F0 sector subunit b n=1 Tax=hydrothermal vent metagenome TaxID=652676 RepID=A0A3B0UJF6_9ZZZZ
MELDNTFWTAAAFFVFLGLMVYLKVPKMVTGNLDAKIDKIQSDLDEAKKLREEAQALLAKYERKRKSAQSEADDIIAAAEEEAVRIADEAKISLEEMIVRKTKSVEEKISQAESQAIAEVRSRSAEIAVEAAKSLLVDQMVDQGDVLIDAAIKDVGVRLN